MRRRRVLAAGLLGASSSITHAAPRTILTVATFPLLDEITAAAIPAWKQLHPDVDIRILNRQYADHHTAMTTALSTAAGLPDVMGLESSFVGRFAQGRGLEDLSREPYRVDRFRSRLVPFAYEQAISPRGEVVAVPADIGPGTMLYRKDIVERAGVGEDLLTRSWESYVEAGRRIKAATGAYLIADVHEIKDILLRTGIAAGQSMYYGRDSEALATSDRFVRAFEVSLAARRLKLDARVKAWSNEWAEGFKRGQLATELGGAWLVGQLSNWVAPQTAGLWRAAALPEGANAAYGGAFYAIPRLADPRRKALGWDFIQLMTLNAPRQLAAFQSHDAFPALLETHEQPFFEEPVAFLGGQPARLLWRKAARQIAASKVHKQNAFGDEVIGTELDKVLNRGKPIKTALADAQRLLERRAFR